MDELPIRREFGRRVRRRRLALDVFQKDLARQIGMPAAQLSRLEKGGYRSINIAKLILLADALHTTTDYLLARSDDPGPVPDSCAGRGVCLRGLAPLPAGNRTACRRYYIPWRRSMESWTKFLDQRRQDSDTEPFKGTPAQRVLQRNIHLIRSKDTTGQMACYYVLVPHTKRSLLLAALKQPETISLEDYGEIVASNYGYKPNEQTKRILRERFGLEV